MYGEETDWCYRFRRAGWKVLFWPGAQIIHLGGASSKKARPEMILQLRGSILLFLRKHSSWLVYRLACLLVGCFFLLRVPYWLGRSLRKIDSDHARMMVKTYLRGWSCMWGGVERLILK
jgi:GT2 family glycosyltransferase